MFFTYIWLELRRRMRQAIFIAIGLALGIGLVITVTAASSGVKDAQASVLHSLYGVGTDITVTKTPTAGAGIPERFGNGKAPKPGSKINDESLRSTGLGAIKTSSLAAVSHLKNVAAAAGGLVLTDTKITGTLPSFSPGGAGRFPDRKGDGVSSGGGGSSGSLTPTSFTVDGVDIGGGELGPLSSSTLASGKTFTSADASSRVAVLDSSYATSNKIKTGDTITVDKKSFKVIGIVNVPAGDTTSDVYIPLGVAQNLSGMKNEVNTIYVAASNSQQVPALSSAIRKAVPGATVTNQDSLASEVTGSISNAASLADNLGKWLAVAVLIAAFLLASLLTMTAVTRRVREFGTLKALGWKSRRIVFQVMGESLAIGIVGGAAGVGLGFLGAALVQHFAPPLSATVGSTTGSATPGGARQFGGGPVFGGPGGGGNSPFGFRNAADAASTVSVHMSAPVTIAAIAAAVVLAILGGLIAGSFGGWRAARLRPAMALSRIE